MAQTVEGTIDHVPSDAARPEPLLLVLLGPTGSGKTALSLALAERFGGEIVRAGLALNSNKRSKSR